MVGTAGTASRHRAMSDVELDREVEALAHALAERGETDRAELARMVGARWWGPGRFRRALREAVQENRGTARRHHRFGPPRGAGAPRGGAPSPG
jgi:hypothetical protein